MTDKTHIESGDSIFGFTHEFLVKCPNCDGMAIVRPHGKSDPEKNIPERVILVCSHCGHNRDRDGNNSVQVSSHPPLDGYFSLPLWLTTPCCGETLWAFNRLHLEYLESFIQADHRKRTPDEDPLRNRTLESRLPKWIKSSKNREELLKGIKRLKAKLPQ